MITTENLKRLKGVYCVIHRNSGRCYVGSSDKCIHGRRLAHLNAARNGKASCFYSALREFGEEAFDFEVLERCSGRKHVLEREEFWITFLKSVWPGGFNSISNPSTGQYCIFTDSARARMSAMRKGVKPTPETVEKRRLAMFGRVCSPETRAKIGAKNRGKKHSLETRAKIKAARAKQVIKPHTAEAKLKVSIGNKGKIRSPEFRSFLSAINKGKSHGPHTEETKQKLRLLNIGRNLGRKHTPESLVKMSAAHKGKKLTPESIIKRTATRKANRLAIVNQSLNSQPPLPFILSP